MPSEKYRVKLKIKNPILQKQIENVLMRLRVFELQGENVLGQTDLMILELGEDLDHDFDLVHHLSGSADVGEIFLASNNPDKEVLIRAMRAGAREFFGPGVSDDEIQAALLRFIEWQKKARIASSQKIGRIITVLGGKGGVGTTTVAVNLAMSLMAKKNVESVALLDMNLFGDIHLFLGIEPTYSWSEITKNISRLDSTFLKNILFSDPSGVHVLPSPGYVHSQNVTPEIIQRLFRVIQQTHDFIVVDIGQQMNESSLKILEISDFVFVVAVQSLPCLAHLNKILVSFRNLGYPREDKTGIILNRYTRKSNIALEDVEASLKKRIMWTISNDYAVTISAINKGQPLNRFAPDHSITESFQQLADTLTDEAEQTNGAKKKKWWWF